MVQSNRSSSSVYVLTIVAKSRLFTAAETHKNAAAPSYGLFLCCSVEVGHGGYRVAVVPRGDSDSSQLQTRISFSLLDILVSDTAVRLPSL